jgi:hypothetical protein
MYQNDDINVKRNIFRYLVQVVHIYILRAVVRMGGEKSTNWRNVPDVKTSVMKFMLLFFLSSHEL